MVKFRVDSGGETVPEVGGVPRMLLLTVTSVSHFKAEELILWMHKAREWVPERDWPGEDSPGYHRNSPGSTVAVRRC